MTEDTARSAIAPTPEYLERGPCPIDLLAYLKDSGVPDEAVYQALGQMLLGLMPNVRDLYTYTIAWTILPDPSELHEDRTWGVCELAAGSLEPRRTARNTEESEVRRRLGPLDLYVRELATAELMKLDPAGNLSRPEATDAPAPAIREPLADELSRFFPNQSEEPEEERRPSRTASASVFSTNPGRVVQDLLVDGVPEAAIRRALGLVLLEIAPEVSQLHRFEEAWGTVADRSTVLDEVVGGVLAGAADALLQVPFEDARPDAVTFADMRVRALFNAELERLAPGAEAGDLLGAAEANTETRSHAGNGRHPTAVHAA